jgi:NADPH-dependent 2,4-dienoyl-CoA reductase/sulfur reductase-like enzyme
VVPIGETTNAYYIRLETLDSPGVIGDLGHALGRSGVSLHSVTQKGVTGDGEAKIVLLTHRVQEKQLQEALEEIRASRQRKRLVSVLRVLPTINAEHTSTLVIVGGGFGGLFAAQTLRHAAVRVTLIDRTNHHLFQPLLYQVHYGGLSPAYIAAPIRSVLRKQANTRSYLRKSQAWISRPAP